MCDQCDQIAHRAVTTIKAIIVEVLELKSDQCDHLLPDVTRHDDQN